MATLTIRNLPDEVRDALRVRAAKAGRSMEAEARRLIQLMLSIAPETSVEERVQKIQAEVRDLFGGKLPSRGVDRFIAERRLAAERGE